MDRRSLSLILVVSLLAWSVNLPAVACPGMNLRAAAMVRAGASPADQPEPSPSRHNCCPDRKDSTPALHSGTQTPCSLHSSPDMSCCTVRSNSFVVPATRAEAKRIPSDSILSAEQSARIDLLTLSEQIPAQAPSPSSPPSVFFSILRL
jgi:hypothetical protein